MAYRAGRGLTLTPMQAALAVLALLLALSAAGNAYQYREARAAAEALGKAQEAGRQAVAAGTACTAGVAALQQAAAARDAAARQRTAAAEKRALAAETRSNALLQALPAVAGDACASIAALNLERLRARKGQP